MKFGVGVLHIVPLSTSFVKIGSVTDTFLLNGVKEIFPIFFIFLPIYIKLDTEDFHKNASGCCDFPNNRYCDVDT
jgi:hypothetical protein